MDDDDASASEDEPPEEVFRGVLAPAASSGKRKGRGTDKRGPTSTKHLYSSTSHPPPPPPAADPAAEAAMMAAMGLPVSLKNFTAESNGDDYEVWAADPANIASNMSLQSSGLTADDNDEESSSSRGGQSQQKRARADGGCHGSTSSSGEAETGRVTLS